MVLVPPVARILAHRANCTAVEHLCISYYDYDYDYDCDYDFDYDYDYDYDYD